MGLYKFVFCIVNISLFVLMPVGPVLAQQYEIQGRVIEYQTSAPVSNLVISIKSSNVEVATDKSGAFHFIRLDTIHNIEFELRYSDYSIRDVNLLYGSYYQVVVVREKEVKEGWSLRDLRNIKVTTASNTEIEVGKAPAIMTVITDQHIQEMGYSDVGEALQYVAGFYLLNDNTQYNLGIRGVNGGMRAGSRIAKVMIDGQAAMFRPGTENFFGPELIPLSAIKRIEVIRGPGSALYGANAFLGVINIITKEGCDDKQTQIKSFAESGKYIKGIGLEVSSGGQINANLSYFFAASWADIDRSGTEVVNIPNYNVYDDSDYSMDEISRPYSLFGKLNYKNNIHSLTFDFNYQHLDASAEFQDWAILTHQNRFNLENYYIRSRYSVEFSSRLKASFVTAFSEGKPGNRDHLDVDSDPVSWNTRDFGNTSIDIQSKLEYRINDKDIFSLGFDHVSDYQNLQTYMINSPGVVPEPVQGIIFGDTLFMNNGLYLQSIQYPFKKFNSNILKTFEITSGIRYDIHNIYGNSFNYRFAGVTEISSKSYLKMVVGSSFKAPSSTQLFSNFIDVGDVVGNPLLKPEKAKTYELAWGMKYSNNLSVSVNGFYNKIYDKVELILPMGEASNIKPGNVSEITSTGIESELFLNFKNVFSFMNLSYQWSLEEKEELKYGLTRLKTALYPSLMFKFGATYSVPQQNLKLHIDGMYIGKRLASLQNSFYYDPVDYRINPYDLPAYFIVNVGVSAQLPMLFGDKKSIIKLKINNLTNSHYVFPGFNNYDIPGFERSIRFSLIHNF
ncbi:MAG: TonB-dependent receptor plug domain-containing protein [Bacteroidales bacterium]|nr:TonB-dependent receptor plug domain-containing protein [Bacteroidales bacterium]